MGWEATEDPWAGGQPGRDLGQPAVGFDHGGAWAEAAPSAALAAALEQAAGPADRYDGAETDALVGITKQWAALESWAAAGKLAALRAMMREDGEGRPLLRRRGDLPDGWDDNLTYEISGALAMGPVSAGNLAHLAWTLGARLAGIGRLLADGTLTLPKARLIVQLLAPLDDDEAARAEVLIVGELAGKTYFQVERLAWRAALAVAPDVAERRRAAAEKQARVTVFREESGTVGLSGRDLPAAEALAGHANVLARAREYEVSGAFPGETASRLQALAYTDLLGQLSAGERIAFARGAGEEPPDGPGSGAASPDGPPGPPGADDGDGTISDDGNGPDETEEPGDGGPGDSGPDEPGSPGTPPSTLAEVTVPLATLQGRAERAGDSRLLGPLDPAVARDLAAAAACSPRSRWEIIVVDEYGYATGHGIARPRQGREPPPTAAARSALPARVNITITEDYLHQVAAQPHSGAPPGAWALTPSKPGTWTLTLPSGRQLAVRFDIVPVYACDHRYAVSSYLPGDRLRRLIQVRDHTCTWPPCSRAASASDFEHAVPYDQGGATCACNAGARSRRCHQVKQLPGWILTQPRPGWHVWQSPTGRVYTQEPWRYTA